jgi:hypothetical protein
VIPLDPADLVLVAAGLWRVEPERALGRIDLDALDRALAEPVPRPGDPAATAAALMCGVRRQQPLPATNDRFALMATVQLLAFNGWRLDDRRPEALARVAKNARKPARAARKLRPMLSRISGTETRRTAMRPGFTDGTRQVLDLAQEEARRFRECVILPQHLLLGLIREEGVAADVLAELRIDLTTARLAVAEASPSGQEPPAGVIGLAPRTRQLLDRAAGEARRAGRADVDTEHLRLAMDQPQHGDLRHVLEVLGVEPDEVRAQVRRRATAPAAVDPEAALRRAVDAALDADDYDLAAALRQQQQEVDRLRELLRRNGIDPAAPAA